MTITVRTSTFALAALVIAAAALPRDAGAQARGDAQASRQGVYLYAAGGRSQYDDGVAWWWVDETGRGTAGRVGGGYRWANGLAAEVGFVDFGKATLEESRDRVRLSGAMAGIAWHLPFGNVAEGVLRGGGIDVKSERTGERERRRFRAYLGLGIQFWIAPQAAIELGWDATSTETRDDTLAVGAATVGLRVRF